MLKRNVLFVVLGLSICLFATSCQATTLPGVMDKWNQATMRQRGNLEQRVARTNERLDFFLAQKIANTRLAIQKLELRLVQLQTPALIELNQDGMIDLLGRYRLQQEAQTEKIRKTVQGLEIEPIPALNERFETIETAIDEILSRLPVAE